MSTVHRRMVRADRLSTGGALGFARCGWLCLFGAMVSNMSYAQGLHQTDTVSPIQVNGELPYELTLRQYSFPAVERPTLHSFAQAQYDGKWLLIAGRTNGLHSLSHSQEGFPKSSQNTDVWVVDLEQQQAWRRSLWDPTSGLDDLQVYSLATTNNQFYQNDNTLYMTGGYGVDPDGLYRTFDRLSAIDVPRLIDWVVDGEGTALSSIRQLSDPLFQVTGGAMYPLEGRTHLVFGQDFAGRYHPFRDGVYTEQVRSFDIVDDGVTLEITNRSTTTPRAEFRRRDLNVYPVLDQGENGLAEKLVALSGVFTIEQGAWTVPVVIGENGSPTMADPIAPETFRQGMNNYHSAKFGLYSSRRDESHEILFGGIGLQYFDELSQSFVTDNQLPFVSQITSVVHGSDGQFSQYLLNAEFPQLTAPSGNSWRFGANAEFFVAPHVPTFPNGMINLDAIHSETVVGYIFGGIMSDNDHGGITGASGEIFEVRLRPTMVPEPIVTPWIALSIIVGFCLVRRSTPF